MPARGGVQLHIHTNYELAWDYLAAELVELPLLPEPEPEPEEAVEAFN